VVIPLEYDELRKVDFASVRACIVKKDEKWGVVNFDNKMVLPSEYDEIEWVDANYDVDYHGVVYEALKDSKWGLYDRKGNMLLPHEYDKLRAEDYDDHPEFWIAQKENRYGIIKLSGEVVVPLEYDKITIFSTKSWRTRFFEIEKEGEPPLVFNRKKIIVKSYKNKKKVDFSTDKET
jgi:hypothetical protein